MRKSFRGSLIDGGQERIRLATSKGKVGYQIRQFTLFPSRPGHGADTESTVQIWKTEQSTPSTTAVTVDFTDSELLAASYLNEATGASNPSGPLMVFFDNEIINQDIYITHSETANSEPVNYYLELEVIPLSDAAAEYTTIKDLRGYINMNPWR